MKGFMGRYVFTIIMFGMFIFIYIALDRAFTPLHTFALGSISSSASLETLAIVNSMWLWLPMAALFSYILYNINKSRREKEVFT